MVKTQSW